MPTCSWESPLWPSAYRRTIVEGKIEDVIRSQRGFITVIVADTIQNSREQRGSERVSFFDLDRVRWEKSTFLLTDSGQWRYNTSCDIWLEASKTYACTLVCYSISSAGQQQWWHKDDHEPGWFNTEGQWPTRTEREGTKISLEGRDKDEWRPRAALNTQWTCWVHLVMMYEVDILLCCKVVVKGRRRNSRGCILNHVDINPHSLSIVEQTSSTHHLHPHHIQQPT